MFELFNNDDNTHRGIGGTSHVAVDLLLGRLVLGLELGLQETADNWIRHANDLPECMR